ncbi:MAG: hypothetical protein D9V47_05845 [Clostridia bacterium]|nr:MAG: hypothetical protein D9V47_05845 [Clostridia bacterium]
MIARVGAPAPPGRTEAPAGGQKTGESKGSAFARVLEQEIRLSRHAAARLQARRIGLEAENLSRLQSALDLAASKGARESLVIMDDTAMVVSVPSRTVITAVDLGQAEERVFTNIDSAVIIRR